MDNIEVKVKGDVFEGEHKAYLIRGESETDKLLIYKNNYNGDLTYRWMVAVPNSKGKWVSNLMLKDGSEVIMAEEVKYG